MITGGTPISRNLQMVEHAASPLCRPSDFFPWWKGDGKMVEQLIKGWSLFDFTYCIMVCSCIFWWCWLTKEFPEFIITLQWKHWRTAEMSAGFWWFLGSIPIPAVEADYRLSIGHILLCAVLSISILLWKGYHITPMFVAFCAHTSIFTGSSPYPIITSALFISIYLV